MKTIKKRMCVIIITHIFARNQIFLFLQIKRETKLTVFERFQSHTAIMPGAQLCKSPFRQKSYICFLVNYRDKIVVLLRHLPTFNWRIHILINLGVHICFPACLPLAFLSQKRLTKNLSSSVERPVLDFVWQSSISKYFGSLILNRSKSSLTFFLFLERWP